jgi:hypothetical protein
MNRRGKRLTLGVMAAGLAVVLVLAIAYRKPILEHIEAWRFQLTRETVTVEPEDMKNGKVKPPEIDQVIFYFLPGFLDRPIIFAPKDAVLITGLVPDDFREMLKAKSYRVLEQRFPRRAWVVIRDKKGREGTP